MKPGLSAMDDMPCRDTHGAQQIQPAAAATQDIAMATNRLLAVVSHELRQPLAELMLNADLILELAPSSGSPELHAIGRHMQVAIRRQTRIIDDLLELSRIRTGRFRLEPVPIDISAMVREACATAALGAPDMQLHVDIQCASGSLCMADPVRVQQILSNLLGNAVKFSRSGGCIDVQLAIERGHARISVADTGCGIAAEFLPHVFSMFGQERPPSASAHAGLGIGLAMVQELATAHGGRVEAFSDGPGHGAIFSVWLPLTGSASAGRSMESRDGGVVAATVVRSAPSRCIGVLQATPRVRS